jgi:hypothetical protein
MDQTKTSCPKTCRISYNFYNPTISRLNAPITMARWTYQILLCLMEKFYTRSKGVAERAKPGQLGCEDFLRLNDCKVNKGAKAMTDWLNKV